MTSRTRLSLGLMGLTIAPIAHADPWDPARDAWRQDGFQQYRSLAPLTGTSPNAPTPDEHPATSIPTDKNSAAFVADFQRRNAVDEALRLENLGQLDAALAAWERAVAIPSPPIDFELQAALVGRENAAFQIRNIGDLATRAMHGRDAQLLRLARATLEHYPDRFTPDTAGVLYRAEYGSLLQRCDTALLGLFAALWNEDVIPGQSPPDDRYRPFAVLTTTMLYDEQLLHCDARAPEAKAAARRLGHLRELVALRDETEPGFAARVRAELDRRLGVPWRVSSASAIASIPKVRKGTPAKKAQAALALLSAFETRAQGIALASDAARAGNANGCEMLATELRLDRTNGYGPVFECSVMLAALEAGAEKKAARCMALFGALLREGTSASRPLPDEGLAWLDRAAKKGDRGARQALNAACAASAQGSPSCKGREHLE